MFSKTSASALGSPGARPDVPRASGSQNSSFALCSRFTQPIPPEKSITPTTLSHANVSLRTRFTHRSDPSTCLFPNPSTSVLPNAKEDFTLRPNVPAKDRIHAWSSPYSIQQCSSNIKKYPLDLIESGQKAVSAGLADSTKTSYGAGILRFNQFCDLMGVEENLRMPADETLLIGFVGHYMGSKSGSCIRSWLSAIQAWHTLAGAPWPSDSKLLKLARKGARIAGTKFKRAQRNPITLAHLLALYSSIDFSNSFHSAIWAVACVAFWGCRRLGELTIPSQNGFNPKYHASRSTEFKITRNSDNTLRSISFHIPWTKSTQEEGATVVGTAQINSLGPFCPVTAVSNYLKANPRIPDNFSLFAYVDADDKPRNMVKSSFLSFCDKIWKSKNMENVQGHSFRIGGAVELLLAGVTPEVVAAIGGWTSLAFLLYWRRFEDILPTHILKAYGDTEISRLKDTIENYQKMNKIPNSLLQACINGLDYTES
ncbi:hypothetical protein EV361DRAFT_794934 [Lentinula raphanica]|nr:hypothetical protein EV361DRAFT_794934 [Lentinula raphanica]